MISIGEEATCVFESDAIVGESPVWCPEEGLLYWVDILGQKIHRFDPSEGRNRHVMLDQPVTGIAKRSSGGIIAALRDGFAFVDPETGEYTRVDDPEEDKPENRFNDAKCDRQGRFWGGTMNATRWDQPEGALYRLDPDLTVHTMQRDTICSNGMGWSPDGRIMYFTESFRCAIFAYDFDVESGSISNRRVFAEVDRESGGFPDGLTVDAEGYVWSAQCALGQIVRYDPSGAVDRVVEFPVPRVTSCIFGMSDFDVLFVTTAQETLSSEQLSRWPLSGSLFALRPGVKGMPEAPFAG